MEKYQNSDNKGFTLVELIIIIAIMAILTAAISIAVIRYIESGRQAVDVYNASLINVLLIPILSQVIFRADPLHLQIL